MKKAWISKEKSARMGKQPDGVRHELPAPANFFNIRSLIVDDNATNLQIRILLAEDNIVNQQVALRILKKLGLQADTAANGLEVLVALESNTYDLILMDVQMPQMDGIETTRRIREMEADNVKWQSQMHRHQPAGFHIPIIAMTAKAILGDENVCLSAGMDDYLSKPLSAKILADKLAKWLPHSSDAGEYKTEKRQPVPI
jgi:CheY-like chemotaxis protein